MLGPDDCLVWDGAAFVAFPHYRPILPGGAQLLPARGFTVTPEAVSRYTRAMVMNPRISAFLAPGIIHHGYRRGKVTVALTPQDAEALAVNRPIRLELVPVMGAYYAHYSGAGQCEHRASRWVPIAGIDAPEKDIAAARREPALTAIELVASDLAARSTRAAFTVV